MQEQESELEYFLKAHEAFDERLQFVYRTIKAVGNHKVEPRRTWANVLFFRLFMIGNSLMLLCDPELRNQEQQGENPVLDHASVAAVARNLLEACIMFSYISEPHISEDEWLLRRLLLDLHDATTRYRVLKAIGDTGEADEYRLKAGELKDSISANRTFQVLDPKRREELLKGQQLYVNGLRSAARSAGLDVGHFNAMQACLSTHTHSSPVSFYRPSLELDDVVPAVAPDLVFCTAGLALEYVTAQLGTACERMFDLYPEIFLAARTKH